MRRILFIILLILSYTNDRHRCRSSQTEAHPQKESSSHRTILAVHRHEQVGEEFDNHAGECEIRNRNLQFGQQEGINERLEHAAENTLNDDESAVSEKKRRVLRKHDGRRIINIG